MKTGEERKVRGSSSLKSAAGRAEEGDRDAVLGLGAAVGEKVVVRLEQ